MFFFFKISILGMGICVSSTACVVFKVYEHIHIYTYMSKMYEQIPYAHIWTVSHKTNSWTVQIIVSWSSCQKIQYHMDCFIKFISFVLQSVWIKNLLIFIQDKWITYSFSNSFHEHLNFYVSFINKDMTF